MTNSTMSESINQNSEEPVFDEKMPYSLHQSVGKPDYVIQGNNVFDHKRKFWYSLKDELPPDQLEGEPEYKAVILDVPEPYEPVYDQKCPMCDYKSTNRFTVDSHTRRVHKKNLRELEKICSTQPQLKE